MTEWSIDLNQKLQNICSWYERIVLRRSQHWEPPPNSEVKLCACDLVQTPLSKVHVYFLTTIKYEKVDIHQLYINFKGNFSVYLTVTINCTYLISMYQFYQLCQSWLNSLKLVCTIINSNSKVLQINWKHKGYPCSECHTCTHTHATAVCVHSYMT